MVSKLYTVALSAFSDKKGAAMVEYALLAALIAVVAVTAISSVGTNLTSTFHTIASKL